MSADERDDEMSDNALATVPTTLEFTSEQRQLIRDAYTNGASDTEFAVLMEIARARRLNPLMRQIHFVQRWDRERGRNVWSAQVSIDGLRTIAQRTGLYDGQDEPEFEEGDDGYPRVCRVRVYRKDWTRPAVGVAHWREFVQTTKDGAVTRMWRTLSHVMLAKVAESIALRKAFPEDVGGIYTDAEMSQADNDLPASPRPKMIEAQPVDEEREGIQAEASHYERAEALIQAARSLDVLSAAWRIVVREAWPHLGPQERVSITAAKDARKAELSKTPPTGTDGPSSSSSDEATPAAEDWTATVDGQRAHVSAMASAHEVRASALKWASKLGPAYVSLCAQRVVALTGGEHTLESAERWCRTPIVRARKAVAA